MCHSLLKMNVIKVKLYAFWHISYSQGLSVSHSYLSFSSRSRLSNISTDVLNSSDSGVQFDINKGKSSGSNFL